MNTTEASLFRKSLLWKTRLYPWKVLSETFSESCDSLVLCLTSPNCQLLNGRVQSQVMNNFLLKEISRGNLNEAISLTETDVTLKKMSISIYEITSSRFPRKIFLKKELTIWPFN